MPDTGRTTFDPNLNLYQSDVNLNQAESRLKRSYYSMPSLATLQGHILEEQKTALRYPQSICTYKDMALDGTLSAAITIILTLLSQSEYKIVAPKDAPELEHRRAEFFNDKLHDLSRPFEHFLDEIYASLLTFGFAPYEKAFQVQSDGPMAGTKYVSDYRLISQDSVSRWLYNVETGKLLGIRQDLALVPSDLRFQKARNYQDVPIGKIVNFRHRPHRDNPEGNSPFKGCYVSWRYKSVGEEYEAIGITKDMGGVVVLGVDAAVLAAADADPNSVDARNLRVMEDNAAAMHAGSQNTIIKPISYTTTGKDRYTLELKGIDGGGKQYDTDRIIRRHSQVMLMNFLADVLNLGADAHGSFALANSKTSTLSLGVRYLQKMDVESTYNHNVMRQQYRLNGWDYNPKTSARLQFGDIDDRDVAIFSKAVQQLLAVGAVRPTEDIEDMVRDIVFNLPPMKDADTEIIETENNTSSGDGMREGLPSGTGQAVSSDDRSAANINNV